MSPCIRMLTGLVLGVACLGTSGVCRGDFVVNGGFETPPYGNGFVTDWTVSGNTSDPTSFGVDSSDPHSGTYAAFFGPQSNPAYLMQDIQGLMPGINYTLDFYLQNEDGTSPNEFSVAFGGTTLLDQKDMPTTPYQEYQYTVVATAPTMTLSFGFRNDFAFFDLDDVSIVRTVPEPASLVCLGVGAALAGGYGFRRRVSGTTA